MDEDPNIRISIELKELLSTFTAAEESAIRQIVPMISILRLTMGNIGSKGNTSCIWQESKLNTILSNLPSDCKVIVIVRQKDANASTTLLKSTKFERYKLEKVLRI